MTTTYHVCINLRDAMLWPDAKLAYAFRRDGKLMNARQARAALMDEVARGHAVLPTTECANFDYERGCLGHREQQA